MKNRGLLFIVTAALCLTGCSAPIEPFSSSVSSSIDDTVYYTIDFDLNGGDSNDYRGPIVVQDFVEDIFFYCFKDGYQFRGWSYNGEKIFDEHGNVLAIPVMAEHMVFVAIFTQTSYVSVFVEDPEAGTAAGSGEFAFGEEVVLTAQANQGYVFQGWYLTNELLSNEAVFTYTVPTEDVVISVRFKYDSFELDVHTNDSYYGKVLLKQPGVTYYQERYVQSIKYKGEVTVSARSEWNDVPFLGWYDMDNNLLSTEDNYYFLMPNHDYEIESKWDHFNISYKLNGGTNNSNNPTFYTTASDGLALYGATKNGYDFAGWKYKGEYVTTIDASWLTDIVLEATWTGALQELSVTSEDVNKGTVSIVSGLGYTDETIKVNATPIGGYIFRGWYDGYTKVCNKPEYEFVMPRKAVSLVARFCLESELAELKLEDQRLGIEPTLSDDGKTVTYGLYPQTVVNDDSLIAELNTLRVREANGWYLYNGEYYIREIAYPSNKEYTTFDNHSRIVYDKQYWFKCELITWNVLSDTNGQLYLLSNKILDCHFYRRMSDAINVEGETFFANNYKYSGIRAYLNGYDGRYYGADDYYGYGFYDTAFYLGNSNILTTVVDNSPSTTETENNQYCCENTEDKVFMPSYQDYINENYGFTSETGKNETRYCKTTDYSRSLGLFVYIDGEFKNNSNYWTRSPDNNTGFISSWVVTEKGILSYSKITGSNGIRPCITLSID